MESCANTDLLGLSIYLGSEESWHRTAIARRVKMCGGGIRRNAQVCTAWYGPTNWAGRGRCNFSPAQYTMGDSNALYIIFCSN